MREQDRLFPARLGEALRVHPPHAAHPDQPNRGLFGNGGGGVYV